MVSQRNRIIKISEYLTSLGIDVNIGKTKALGNKGFFKCKEKNKYRIDITKGLTDEAILSTLVHEFAHYFHFINDNTLKKLDFIFGDIDNSLKEELINVTVQLIPKGSAQELFNQKEVLSKHIRELSRSIKAVYPNFKLSQPNKEIEKSLKNPIKYLLKYDKIKIFNQIYSVENLETDFKNLNKIQVSYIILKSKKRALSRINARISKLNKYYNNPSELFARFVESYFIKPEKTKVLAPVLTKKFDNVIEENIYPELTKFVTFLN